MSSNTCRRCHRRLTSEKAQRAGVGKTCARKMKEQSVNQLKLALKPSRRRNG